ncbi:trophoblast glycoprotein-like [Scomber scombrus]|uniref:Trophoblast glycoprotein-like n=3 Tax=Scomber scombrus TaxID=13677 RepID=A0AAV1P7F6_SCOSC
MRFLLLLLIGYNLEMCISAVRSVFLGVLLYAPYQCLECPFGCECFAVTCTVRCDSKDLLTVPQLIPGYAKTVIITGNNIQQTGPDSFTELENVTNITLSNNR